ncbi:hypothetical protein [Streptomyces sp. NPDC014685]|uniref:hypothetical protein n=1 Tax=Streptomyces sp. NPDC014685 TaxID=3364881 RepID=UPI0036FB442F
MSATSVHVRWGALDLTFSAPQHEVARWLTAHFHTAPEADREDGHRVEVPHREDVRITAVVDGSLVDRIVADARSAGTRQVEGHVGEFWLVGESDGCPVWCHGLVSDDRVDPADLASGRHVIVATGPGAWLVAGHTAAELSVATVRFTRELIRLAHAQRGFLTLHAATATRPRHGGLLVLGASGSGKSTLALALAQDGGHLVSGDQTEVVAGGGGVVGVGFPWVARIGAGTLTGLGMAQAVISASLLRAQPAVHETAFRPEATTVGSPLKVELTMEELDVLLGVRPVDRARVHGIVVLERSSDGEAHHCVETDIDSVWSTMCAELREPDPAFASFWLVPPGARQPAARTTDELRRALHGLRVFRMTWAPDRDDLHAVLRSLDHALDGAAREVRS